MSKKEIQAGVVLVQKFVTPADSPDKGFSGYLEYQDREEAVLWEEKKKKMFEGYLDYMDNPEKHSCLFGADFDYPSEDKKKILKLLYKKAEEKNSNLYLPVFSFDTIFLKKHGLYYDGIEDNEESKASKKYTGWLNEKRIKEYVRTSVKRMLEKEKMIDSSIWTATFHYNTEQVHVHVSVVEPTPTREIYKYNDDGVPEYKGYWSKRTIEAGKSLMVNNIINQKETNIKINTMIRGDFISGRKNQNLSILNDHKIKKLYAEIYDELPKEDLRLWNYNVTSIYHLKEKIDAITELYLEKYHKNEFKEFKELIKKSSNDYIEAYGERKDKSKLDDYIKNKMGDLYTRMGNATLSELKSYHKNLLQDEKEKRQKSYEKAVENYYKNKKGYEHNKAIRSLKNLKHNLGKSFKECRAAYLHQRLQDEIQSELEH